MSEIMETHARKTCILEQFVKQVINMIWKEEVSFTVTEHDITLLPGRTHLPSRLFLAEAMLLECLKNKVRKVDFTPPLRGFRLIFNKSIAGNAVDCAAYL